MTQKQRIEAFVGLSQTLSADQEKTAKIIQVAAARNPWYTVNNVQKQLTTISAQLTFENLTAWLAPYPDLETSQVVGLILAGNIPLVGFHDIMCVLLSGFRAQIKVSSDDAGLTPFVLQELVSLEPAFADRFEIVERLSGYDLIIATGSDNTARYFEYYFGKKPHIIRKNRNSVALLTGQENTERLKGLGADIFDYFGLGCRSVSKIFVPKGYSLSRFFEAIEDFKEIREHFKYANNYDYNKSIYLINGDKHFDNGFLLLKEDERMASPLAVVFFEEYDNVDSVTKKLNAEADKIQCLVTDATIDSQIPTFSLGRSQCPGLTDYADGIDILHFLFNHAL